MTSTTSCTTVPHTIKIVICRSAVVVHTMQPYSTSTLVTPKEEHATRLHCTTEIAVETLSTTKLTQRDPPQSAQQHRTLPAHHQQEYMQPTALLRTTSCPGGLTRLQPRRISWLSGQQVAQADSLACSLAGSLGSPDNRLPRTDLLACSFAGTLRNSGQQAA